MIYVQKVKSLFATDEQKKSLIPKSTNQSIIAHHKLKNLKLKNSLHHILSFEYYTSPLTYIHSSILYGCFVQFTTYLKKKIN